MKKTLLFITALALTVLTLVTSCQKEGQLFRFTAGEEIRFAVGSAGGAATKTAYSGKGTATLERIDWEVNDRIRIYCGAVSEPADTKWADYTVTSVVPSSATSTDSYAYIEGTGGIGLRWGTGDHTFYAVTPSAVIGENDSKVTASANVSASQVPVLELTEDEKNAAAVTIAAGGTRTLGADMRNMFMVAKSGPYTEEAGIPEGEEVFLAFTPLTTAIEFTITNGTSADMTLTSVSLISGNGKSTAEPVINGNFSIDLDSWAEPELAMSSDGSMTVSYENGRKYPACTGAETSADMSARTVTIDFGKDITLAAKTAEKDGGSLTFTFLLTPTHDFEDLTFKLTKSDDSWMSTRLGYTDGSGIFFPHFKKTKVEGLFIPEGVQWTVKYGPDVQPWNTSDDPIKPMPEIGGRTAVTSWDTGTDGDLTLEPKENNDLLPGKFSVSATKYVQFSRGNLFCTRSGSEDSYTYEFGLENKQYEFHTRYGKIHYLNAYTSEKIEDPSTIPGIKYTENTSGLFQWVSENAQGQTADILAGYGAFSELSDSECKGQGTDIIDWGKAYGDGNLWSTLSSTEWSHIISGRENASKLHKWSTVCNVKGLILAPDGWDGTIETSYDENAWETAESSGLVFLPAASLFLPKPRDYIESICNSGDYWSSSACNEDYACVMTFGNGEPKLANYNRHNGHSVRLVQRKPYDAVEIDGLYWATENLAITASGKKEWKGSGHIVGDYFQWAAYEGVCGNPEDADRGLLIYTSFSNTNCDDGGVSDAFEFKNNMSEKKYRFSLSDAHGNSVGIAPYYDKTGSAFTKYTTGDKKTVLERNTVNDDVASIILGGSWRMPTSAEFLAMKEATYWAWDSSDLGFYIFAPDDTHTAGARADDNIPGDLSKSDALLFLPAAGYGSSDETVAAMINAGVRGRYWTSTLYSSDHNQAYFLDFRNKNVDLDAKYGRFNGMSIRPVHD